MIYEKIEDLIGKTPLVHISATEREEGTVARLLVKLESFNPGGSAKDRIAREIFGKLRQKVNVMWDVSGAIGRRYRRQDEAGTPWCITVDDQTVQDGTFTVRDRDSMEQKRMTYAEFLEMMYSALEF